MAFSLVSGQHAYTASGPGLFSTVAPALPSNPTTGNLVVIGALWANFVNASSAVTSIQDANSNTYTTSPNTPESTSGSSIGALYLFYLLNAPANADKTVTITWGTQAVYTSAFIAEFTATSLPAIFDDDAKGSGTGSTVNLPSVPVAGSNELLIGYGTATDSVTSANSPWTATETLPVTLGDCLAYILDRSSNTTLDFTTSSSNPWEGIGMSFKMTPTGAVVSRLPLIGVGT